MGAPRGCARVIRDWYSLIGALACGVHNPQEFGGQELTFGEEVVAISGVEPDFIVTAEVLKPLQGMAVMLVDDDRIRVTIRRRRVAAK